MDEKNDPKAEELLKMLDKLLGRKPDIDSKTVTLLNKADDLYAKVSGMEDMDPANGGKGYSLGGACERLGLYAGISWSEIDSKLAQVYHSMQNNIEELAERLSSSKDPDDVTLYIELRTNTAMHLNQNTMYHAFWIGYFLNEIGLQEELLTPVDESAIPVPPLDEAEVLRVAANATQQAMADIATVERLEDETTEAFEERLKNHRMPSLGITMDELVSFQGAATRASNSVIKNSDDIESLFVEQEHGVNVFGMNLALGIMIGRALEKRG